MKNIRFSSTLIVLLIVVFGIGAYLGLRNYKLASPSPLTSNSESVFQDPSLISFIKDNHSLSQKSMVEVKIIEGNYAYGNAQETDESGFYWAAAKINGEWNYSFGGNGIPTCEEVSIFPVGTFKGKFDQCYNDKNQLVDRKTDR